MGSNQYKGLEARYGDWQVTLLPPEGLTLHPLMNPFPPPGGGPVLVDHHSRAPAWKRLHRSPFFWIAAISILVAITIFVLTNGLAFWPSGKPVPATVP